MLAGRIDEVRCAVKTMLAKVVPTLCVLLLISCEFDPLDQPAGSTGGDSYPAPEGGECLAGYVLMDEMCEPSTVAVYIVGVTAGPSRADGTEWDGAGLLAQQIAGDLSAIIASGDSEAILSYMSGLNAENLQKPDLFGFGHIAPEGAYVADFVVALAGPTTNLENSFSPVFPVGTGWFDVPMSENLRIAVEIWDEDLPLSEPVGLAELNIHDLLDALHAGHVHQVEVADQTSNQLLLVGISVLSQVN